MATPTGFNVLGDKECSEMSGKGGEVRDHGYGRSYWKG